MKLLLLNYYVTYLVVWFCFFVHFVINVFIIGLLVFGSVCSVEDMCNGITRYSVRHATDTVLQKIIFRLF